LRGPVLLACQGIAGKGEDRESTHETTGLVPCLRRYPVPSIPASAG
jgi:hypothetical protein